MLKRHKKLSLWKSFAASMLRLVCAIIADEARCGRKKIIKIASKITIISYICTPKGEMSEWSNEQTWKVCIRDDCIEGSNPSLSAESYFQSF